MKTILLILCLLAGFLFGVVPMIMGLEYFLMKDGLEWSQIFYKVQKDKQWIVAIGFITPWLYTLIDLFLKFLERITK